VLLCQIRLLLFNMYRNLYFIIEVYTLGYEHHPMLATPSRN
jgi:hypothetical protein